ncbi:hypothetical protein BRC93_03225 [Halobacteriales archaeon QS_5_70_15]|nr:MAG: hypothetical protein BRC93_03225 [Halobacteriales archaeon QS_5_70_15]
MAGPLDPVGYDTAELRELARVRGDRYVADGFLWTTLPDSFPPDDGAAEFDRPATWTGSLDERQKPYLRRLPGNERGRRVAREWIADLVERAGADGAVEALAYYESIGWITESVREGLEGYLLAVDYRAGGSLEDLTRADHVESLGRTARLAGLADSAGDREDRDDAPPEDAGRVKDDTGGDAAERDAVEGGDGRSVERSGTGSEGEAEAESRTEDVGATEAGFEFGATTE